MFFALFISLILASCSFTNKQTENVKNLNMDNITSSNLDTAVFGAGCFWCVEAIFQELKGVEALAGGNVAGRIRR